MDNYVIATMMLSGDHYKINNALIYNNLKPLIVDGRSLIEPRTAGELCWRSRNKLKATQQNGPERQALTLYS